MKNQKNDFTIIKIVMLSTKDLAILFVPKVNITHVKIWNNITWNRRLLEFTNLCIFINWNKL